MFAIFGAVTSYYFLSIAIHYVNIFKQAIFFLTLLKIFEKLHNRRFYNPPFPRTSFTLRRRIINSFIHILFYCFFLFFFSSSFRLAIIILSFICTHFFFLFFTDTKKISHLAPQLLIKKFHVSPTYEHTCKASKLILVYN